MRFALKKLHQDSAVALGSLVSAEGADGQPLNSPETGRIVLTEKEYFEAPGFVLLIHHDNDPGSRGGWLASSSPVCVGRGAGMMH